MVRLEACSSCGDFIDRGGYFKKACWSRLYAWKNLHSKVVWSIQLMIYLIIQHYNTSLSQFLCAIFLCCVISLHRSDVTGYTLDSTAGPWLTTADEVFPGTYSHTSECPCCLGATFIPGFVMFLDYWFPINDWRTVISFLVLRIRNEYSNTSTKIMTVMCY